jgi:hypothetical protein
VYDVVTYAKSFSSVEKGSSTATLFVHAANVSGGSRRAMAVRSLESDGISGM